MKTSRSANNRQSKQGMGHKPRREIRDDMDSRQNKELVQGNRLPEKDNTRRPPLNKNK